jgi:hypothetical protein
MYKLLNGQLLQLLEVVTPHQTALVTTTVCQVIGYDMSVPLDFETIPQKDEPNGSQAELHYVDGELVWIYKTSVTTEMRISRIEEEGAELKQAIAELTMMIAAAPQA